MPPMARDKRRPQSRKRYLVLCGLCVTCLFSRKARKPLKENRRKMADKLTAKSFFDKLTALRSDAELKKHRRYFKFDIDNQDKDDYFIGVRMGSIFELGKEFKDM